MNVSSWNTYERHDFRFDGRDVIIVTPRTSAVNNPWVWRAEFFGAFDYADRALLERGWHIAYYRVSNMYGCPRAILLMKQFHDYIVKRYNLSGKADLFGFSRGGLYASNYTLEYPGDVSTLYLDAPVLDIRSWPAGYGRGARSENEWKECMDLYGLTEDTAKDFSGNPADRLDDLIRTLVPVVLVAGDSDEVVPYEENGKLLVDRFAKARAKIKAIVKKGVGHHPHSLENPEEIVSFIMENR